MKARYCSRTQGADSGLPVQPFLKWPGGKRWLAPIIAELASTIPYERYVEPFLGGGAAFFAVAPRRALLSDVNDDLINTYRQVAYRPRVIQERLAQIKISKQMYLAIRASSPTSNCERAVRFLYLNRTAFGGMYRLNSLGQFNVPYGGGERTTAPLLKGDLLLRSSQMLRTATITTSDYVDAFANLRPGDLVYCDPTYTVTHNNNGFIRYNESNFSWGDQRRLAHLCETATRRGVFVIVSNAFHRDVRALYPSATAHVLQRSSLLCPKASYRRHVKEYLFVLAP